MHSKSIQGVQWLEFKSLSPISRLKHAVFLRHGGFSCAPYDTLNVSRGHDDIVHVEKNRKLIEQILEIPPLIDANQVHGRDIVWVQKRGELIQKGDILMTQTPGLPLMMKHADCQVAIMYDVKTHSLALVHAGWRGQVIGVYAQAIEAMRSAFGTQPQDLRVGIGPSLGPDHSEFREYQREFPEALWQFQTKPYYFDLWRLGVEQLEKCGILSSHIEIARICTYANFKNYFSYRRDKIKGRGHATVAMLS